MNRRQQILDIARWEFLRFFKLRDLILSIVIVGSVTAAIQGISYWQERSRPIVRLALIAPTPLDIGSDLEAAFEKDRFTVTRHQPGTEQTLRDAILRDDLDGVLCVTKGPESGSWHAVVLSHKEPLWLPDVTAAVNATLRDIKLSALDVDRTALDAALAPVPVTVELLDGSAQGSGGAQVVFAGLLIGLVILSLVTGMSYLFVSITGEKQQRITEQLFSMTSAQSLIDGKLLGIGAVSLIGAVQMSLIGLAVFALFDDGAMSRAWQLITAVSLVDVTVLSGFAIAGFGFWFVLCGALFATIDDPHSSARNSVLALPMLAPAAVFLGIGSPDSAMMHVLSWLPPTAMTVMPARAFLTDVAWWEIAGSLAVSLAAIWFVRRAAGRLYEAAMLMYGKEPSFAEMIRWMRTGRDERPAAQRPG